MPAGYYQCNTIQHAVPWLRLYKRMIFLNKSVNLTAALESGGSAGLLVLKWIHTGPQDFSMPPSGRRASASCAALPSSGGNGRRVTSGLGHGGLIRASSDKSRQEVTCRAGACFCRPFGALLARQVGYAQFAGHLHVVVCCVPPVAGTRLAFTATRVRTIRVSTSLSLPHESALPHAPATNRRPASRQNLCVVFSATQNPGVRITNQIPQ